MQNLPRPSAPFISFRAPGPLAGSKEDPIMIMEQIMDKETVPSAQWRISYPIGEERAIFVTPTARGTNVIAGRPAPSRFLSVSRMQSLECNAF